MTTLKSFVERFKLLCDLDVALIDKLQDHEDRLSALEKSHEKNRQLTQGNSQRIGEITLLLGQYGLVNNK